MAAPSLTVLWFRNDLRVRDNALLQHPEVKPFIPTSNLPTSIFDSIRRIQQLAGLFTSNYGAFWALCNPESKLIGTVGFDTFCQRHKRLDIAFELHPDYQGKGLMTQAISQIIPFGFEDLGAIRIQAYTLADNHPSMQLLLRCGFTKEGVMSRYQIFNGEVSDVAIFGLTKHD